jgi:RHS repeat-associated protein
VYGTYARTGLPAATTATAVYDAANRLTSWNGGAVTSDANGNQTSQAGITTSYNARNQLTSITQGSTTLATFGYDGAGRRISKTLSGTTTKLVFDGWNPIQEQNAGGTPTANLIPGLGLDQLFVRTDASTRSLLTDALGSVIALADTSGVVRTSYTYEPFGKTGTSGQASSNLYRFTGREDDSTGGLSLYGFRARSYSPVTQRFVSEDPIGVAGGDVNLYSYVGDAPTEYTDPQGTTVAGGGGGGFGTTGGRKDAGCGFLGIGCADDALAGFWDWLVQNRWQILTLTSAVVCMTPATFMCGFFAGSFVPGEGVLGTRASGGLQHGVPEVNRVQPGYDGSDPCRRSPLGQGGLDRCWCHARE